jgi:hypothetical protein
MSNIADHPTRDNPIVTPKNTREELRLSLTEYNHHWPAFCAGLDELEAEMRACGLLDEEGLV